MKKCGWWKGHCSHPIRETYRRVKRNKSKECALENDFVYRNFYGNCVDTIVDTKCCHCGKIKQLKLRDFDIGRAMEYPIEEEK